MRSLTTVHVALAAAIALLVLAGWPAPTAHAAPVHTSTPGPTPGKVRFVKRTNTAFDRFTDRPSPALAEWFRSHYWRMVVFSPYFDARSAWYPGGWSYRDLYWIPRKPRMSRRERRWILRDRRGRPLYVPSTCHPGYCSHYAGDFTNKSFRRHWIRSARAELRRARYAGLWLDDVNMELRTANAAGREVRPVDRRTKRWMSYARWRKSVAAFVVEIRRALPGVEIVHNSIWFGGHRVGRDSDRYVRRQIRAADYINVERGVNDAGLTGGSGEWSVNALLAYIDRVHAAGKPVVLDSAAVGEAEREYGLASYFLIDTGRDGIGNSVGGNPDDWWSGYDVTLGAPTSGRYVWEGLLRRDFERGVVLLNEPSAPERTVVLGQALIDLRGVPRPVVTLGPARGAVLRRP
ncbi:MAG: putative glycoside hydrolase family 15 protein [Actinomycetota bacterium]|nr:putative glycoside hydrolase family 15 protein [Actinomycetota bacterium]